MKCTITLLLASATFLSGCAGKRRSTDQLMARPASDLIDLHGEEDAAIVGHDPVYVQSIRGHAINRIRKDGGPDREPFIVDAIQGFVTIGMTMDEARLAWGRPRKVYRSDSAYGACEVWTRDFNGLQGDWTISFRDGIVQWMEAIGHDRH